MYIGREAKALSVLEIFIFAVLPGQPGLLVFATDMVFQV
jgi:membrane carboxypeptidase/penicillin-binding protein PbpC